jgi:4-oxalocrotonate tautomerase family enzyme
MPFIQITVARGHDAVTKRALVTQVSEAAAAATGTPQAAFRVWIVEVDPDEVSVGGVILADQRREGQG